MLLGILFDLDLKLLHPSALLPQIPDTPVEFYETVVKNWINRHAVLAKSEVRNSGGGLHVILRFDQPVNFETEGERDRWAGIVDVVQTALPIDPDQPGITAVTRSAGSINSKTKTAVAVLKAAEPVTPAEVRSLYQQMIEQPFGTLFGILVGQDSLTPCPVCRKEGSTLKPGRRVAFVTDPADRCGLSNSTIWCCHCGTLSLRE